MASRALSRVSGVAPSMRRIALTPRSQQAGFASEAGLATGKEAAQTSSITAPAPPVKPVSAPLPPKRGSSIVDRFWAFLVGVGVGGIGFYYKLSEDIVESTAEIDTRIVGLRADIASANEALRRRVATLEHQLQEVQDRLEK